MQNTVKYEVVAIGPSRLHVQVYVGERDGDALTRAGRILRALAAAAVPAGLYVDGKHEAGHDVREAAIPAAPAAECRTRTFLYDHGTRLNWRKAQVVGIPEAWAVCTCGQRGLYGTRDIARRMAKRHRETGTPLAGAR